MKLIGSYKNGNYTTMLFDDGTKVRTNKIEPKPGQNPDECFIADFPESIDITIGHRCNHGCPMCYAGCTADGKNGDILNAKWLDSLHPFTEAAVGGCDIFEHPDLIPFLEKLRDKKVIANITVNQDHFIKHFHEIKLMYDNRLVTGVGVSVFEPTEELIGLMRQLPHSVAHCIVGVIKESQLKKMFDKGIKLLLLGYKETNRGISYKENHDSLIRINTDSVSNMFDSLVEHFSVVSFDNLAIKQLGVREKLTDEQYARFFMGDDGVDGRMTSGTMYIDMVDNIFSFNSMSDMHFFIEKEDTVDDMYQFLRDFNNIFGGTNVDICFKRAEED